MYSLMALLMISSCFSFPFFHAFFHLLMNMPFSSFKNSQKHPLNPETSLVKVMSYHGMTVGAIMFLRSFKI